MALHLAQGHWGFVTWTSNRQEKNTIKSKWVKANLPVNIYKHWYRYEPQSWTRNDLISREYLTKEARMVLWQKHSKDSSTTVCWSEFLDRRCKVYGSRDSVLNGIMVIMWLCPSELAANANQSYIYVTTLRNVAGQTIIHRALRCARKTTKGSCFEVNRSSRVILNSACMPLDLARVSRECSHDGWEWSLVTPHRLIREAPSTMSNCVLLHELTEAVNRNVERAISNSALQSLQFIFFVVWSDWSQNDF